MIISVREKMISAVLVASIPVAFLVEGNGHEQNFDFYVDNIIFSK